MDVSQQAVKDWKEETWNKMAKITDKKRSMTSKSAVSVRGRTRTQTTKALKMDGWMDDGQGR